MNKIACPHCNKPTIIWWRKQWLGPARRINCPECSAKVSVAWKNSIPTIIAPMIAIISVFYFGPEIRRLTGLAWGATLTVLFFMLVLVIIGAYHHFFVPLEVRAKPRNERIAEFLGSEDVGK